MLSTVLRPPRFFTVPAPRGGPLLWGQHTPRLGQDHPREAPPVGDAAAVDVVLEVVACSAAKSVAHSWVSWSSQAWSSADRSSSVKSSRVKPHIARQTALNSRSIASSPPSRSSWCSRRGARRDRLVRSAGILHRPRASVFRPGAEHRIMKILRLARTHRAHARQARQRSARRPGQDR